MRAKPDIRRRLLSGLSRAAWIAPTVALSVAAYLGLPAEAQIAVRDQGYMPYTEAPIHYRTREVTDPVALLQKDLESGKVKLTYEPGPHGYLKSVLKLLNVPIESQTLVFSKTSFQYTHISPEHPRALYFNDDVYVGAVHEGDTIEIVSFDPMQGAIFYLLEEQEANKPAFQRAELDCSQCHIVAGTRGVPGVLLRSVYPTEVGHQAGRAPSYITDQKSPWKERWGGWYVTGSLAKSSMANAVSGPLGPVTDNAIRPPPELKPVPQPYDPSSYLAPGSDQVALLVLAHQTQMHNLITLVNYQTRLALHALDKANGATPTAPIGEVSSLSALSEQAQNQIKRPSEQLLRYLLFSGETSLGNRSGEQAIAASAFARGFAASGLRDSRKRSLRDFDLGDRIFKYPCSYLIYSSAFDAIPEPAKGYIYSRLLEVLTGKDQSPDFANLSAEDRQAILAILLETKTGLPAEWRDYARANKLRVAALSPNINKTNAFKN